jgi:hypothetical protein
VSQWISNRCSAGGIENSESRIKASSCIVSNGDGAVERAHSGFAGWHFFLGESISVRMIVASVAVLGGVALVLGSKQGG